jgi:type IV secretory pathway TraG/TraD family ATPase VirD4
MKFKFKAEPKDLLYFILFMIFLLYIVAIGILNASSIAQNNEIHGLNPIKAFSPDFIGTTFAFYLLAILGISASVSSYFFDTEKGFGLSKGKSNSDGYSRWAKKEEIKKVLKKVKNSSPTAEYAGIPIITESKETWLDDGESHSLIIGSTGSGKTRRLVHPLIKFLAKKGESMVLTDPKGELYEENASLLIEKGYNIVILNLREPSKGNAWNPLMLPYKLYKEGSDKANELLSDLAINLLYDDKNANDPFWENTSADYFTALALGLFEDAKEEQINLNSISFMSNVGEEKFGGSNYIKEYFMSKDPSKPVYINASGTINAPDTTKDSILSVFRQKIKIFAITEHLSEMLSYSDFDMKDIGKQKTAVFIIIQDEKKTYHALATVFVKQCYETLIDVAHANNGKLPIRTNFILDEFANMPPLKDVTTMITAARSRQIRFNLIIQNYAQLNQVYGKENAETIKGNCANVIYLITKELAALEELSKLCGEKEVKDKEGKKTAKPLVTISDLQSLKMGDAIIRKDRANPFKTKYMDISEYNFDEHKGIRPSYPARMKRPVSLFDIREFVREKKKDSIFNMFGNEKNMGYHPHDKIPTSNNPFDVDDLIKKIDAKIAQLEAEEELEQQGKMKPPSFAGLDEIPKIAQYDYNIPDDNITEEVPLNINNDIDNILNDCKKEDVSDDAFFDDFFSDDEE